jgi:hypothetical protein
VCFSLLASVSAGTVLTVAGVATWKMAGRRAERPLALIPLLFGLQQLTEGAVWWSLGRHDVAVTAASSFVYMLFSHVLWPFFVPFAVLSMEVVAWRRRVVSACLVLGTAVGLHLLSTMVRAPSIARVAGSSLQYDRPSLSIIGLYLLATCGGALVSSHRILRIMGIAALGLASVTLWLYLAVFVSVWCFFSAILTLLIVGYFWSLRRSRRSGAQTVGASTVS